MPFLCSWDPIGSIWAIVTGFERQNCIMPLLGFLELWASNLILQADSVKTETTNGLADPDLGGVALIPAFEFMYFAGSKNRATGEDDRSPSSGVADSVDRRGGWRGEITRSNSSIQKQMGPARWLCFDFKYSWHVTTYIHLISAFQTPNAWWCSG